MKQALALLFYTLLYLSTASHTLAHTYYISPKGDDTNTGSSPASAWRSLARANSHRYSPGDTLLLEGGYTFAGGLYFHQGNFSGDGDPLVVSSFGNGRATIEAGTGYGFYAHNVASIEIRNLNFRGSGYTRNTNHGILFYNDLPGNVKLPHIVIDQVEVSGFRKSGITLGAWNGKSGYREARITQAVVHDIDSVGINVFGEFDHTKTGYAHRNIYVGHCHVYKIYGLILPDKHSGSGIVLSDVDGGTIEHSVVHTSGMQNKNCGGPIGIWAWDANAITIQYNEAYNMSAGSGCDGGGFDLDGGVTNSVMQYNYSHDNDGAGFLIAQFEWARPMRNNVIRYNISENDGRKNGYKSITLWVENHERSGNLDLLVYNNTIFADSAVAPSGGGVFIKSGGHHNVRFFNNIFYSRNGAPLVVATDTTMDVSFHHNAYFSEDNRYTFVWGDGRYTSLHDFQAATRQETMDGAPTGMVADPKLLAPGTAGTLGYPLNQEALRDRYSLHKKSPLIGQGIAVPLPPSFAPAQEDIFGNQIEPTTAPDMGAIAYTRPKFFQWLKALF
ncbi:right-handed parallel beta-helix repeat-containing protein [Pontibacter ramchanderi]|uniref:Parallel beta helix pectate lyase-like protein n=1 Tax=Pontibacter ramchanderi TaxID=1179743 RepID=A0A2N3U9P4_9BACT|nr:right-handed parallel beta-helix repeat-containing protein [Pontibacter ramchanderi]PKV63467.1 parallel beta helix pectate lyase-like protein [Pontibacter ramchanderi]